MRIAVGTDHGGFAIKDTIINTLTALGHEVVDVGAYEIDPKDDYPDTAVAVGRAVLSGAAQRGVAICGSGVGVAIAANKMKGIRACLCHDTYSAAQGVQHDNMNVLCLGGRIIGPALADALVAAFAGAQFDTAERFLRRAAKVQAVEDAGGHA